MAEAVIVEAACARPSVSAMAACPGCIRQSCSAVLNALVERAGVDPALVDDVIWGCVMQAGEQGSRYRPHRPADRRLARIGSGVTVDRQCGSSQQSVHFAAAGVVAGHYDVVVAGGVESMSRTPMGASLANGGNPYPAGFKAATTARPTRASAPR